MKQKPILFSTPMIQAILAGRKTMTRRIIKPQPIIDNDSGYTFYGKHAMDIHGWADEIITECPYLVDHLWVREKFSCLESFDFFNPNVPTDIPGYWYWADGEPEWGNWTKPKPSIYMPKAACRIWLEVVNVGVERLQEISGEDCLREGIVKGENLVRVDFMKLWKKINGPDSWEANPSVWKIEFKQIEKP